MIRNSIVSLSYSTVTKLIYPLAANLDRVPSADTPLYGSVGEEEGIVSAMDNQGEFSFFFPLIPSLLFIFSLVDLYDMLEEPRATNNGIGYEPADTFLSNISKKKELYKEFFFFFFFDLTTTLFLHCLRFPFARQCFRSSEGQSLHEKSAFLALTVSLGSIKKDSI